MRRIRYSVAMSLDGFIAGPNGESDWIVMDPEFDFGAMMSQFDAVLLGRRTYTVEVAIIPVLLGSGIPLLPDPASRAKLRLAKSRVYEKTGTTSLEYEVV